MAQIKSAVVNEAKRGGGDVVDDHDGEGVVVELLKCSDRESISKKNKSKYSVLHSIARGGHRGEWRPKKLLLCLFLDYSLEEKKKFNHTS